MILRWVRARRQRIERQRAADQNVKTAFAKTLNIGIAHIVSLGDRLGTYAKTGEFAASDWDDYHEALSSYLAALAEQRAAYE